MKRHLDKPSSAVLAAFAVNVAAIFILPPPLFVYLVIVDLFAGFIAVVGMYLAADQRAEIAEHRALQAEIGEEIAQDLLDRYRRDARVVVPIKPAPLRVIPGGPRTTGITPDRGFAAIPTQRTPESAEVSDYSWPETARQIEHDELAPPKPPEPKGWGAVVEDNTGAYWTLYAPEAGTWINYREGKSLWDGIEAVRIVSEGVQA